MCMVRTSMLRITGGVFTTSGYVVWLTLLAGGKSPLNLVLKPSPLITNNKLNTDIKKFAKPESRLEDTFAVLSLVATFMAVVNSLQGNLLITL